MRLEQLQAFLAIVHAGSFQEAARKRGVTQSTVSRQIQGLEGDLGLPLFHRGGHSKLTVAGEQLLPRVRKILAEWESATQEIKDLRAGKQPELCVAAIHSVCAHYLPPVLQKFCQLYPEVQLRVTSLGSDRSLKVLKDGMVDLAIVMDNHFLTKSGEMVVDWLYDEPILALMAADHPLTKYEMIPWTELSKFPQVMFKDGYGMQRLVQDQFKKLGLDLNTVLELNTLDAFRGVIRQGQMVSLLPQGALVESQTDPTLAIRSLECLAEADGSSANALTRQVVMVTTQDRLEIPPIASFRRLVHESFLTHLRQSEPGTVTPLSRSQITPKSA